MIFDMKEAKRIYAKICDGSADMIDKNIGWLLFGNAIDRIEELEAALVEERAYILSCTTLESIGIDEFMRKAAREQLRVEGVL